MLTALNKLAANDPIYLPEKNDRVLTPASLYDIDGSGYEMAEDEIAIDLFCGAGGTSEGIRMAIKESPMFALNHNPVALGVHSANHPDTIHLESDVFAMDPSDHIPPNVSIGLMTASPSCVFFSRARGGAPLNREIRDQAWVVCNYAEHPNPRFRPRVIVIENVAEFCQWAPLTSAGKVDKRFINKNKQGSIFLEWRDRIITAGYTFEYRVLNAADYGAGTKRKRLIMIARRDGLPIRYPAPTHGPRNSADVKSGRLLPYSTAASHLDFNIPCAPIFLSKEEAKRRGVKRPLAENTLKRIAAGVEIHVVEADDPYIISYHAPKPGERFRGQSLSEPLATQTTENRFALISPLVSPLTHSGPGRYYALDQQLPVITSAHRGELAVIQPVVTLEAARSKPPMPFEMECALLPHSEPNSTLATHVRSDVGDSPLMTSPFIAGAGGGEYAGKPRPADIPINTLTVHSRQAVIIPSLIRVCHGDVDKNGKRRGRANHDILEPLPTQSTSNEFALVAPKLQVQNSGEGLRAATMIQIGYGERPGQSPRIKDIREPAGTFVSECTKHGLVTVSLQPSALTDQDLANRSSYVAAHMAQQNADNVGHSMHEPISTMTTKVCHQNLVTSHLLTLRQNTHGQSMNEPISAFCAAGNHHAEIRTCLVKYYGNGREDQETHNSPEALTTTTGFSVVQVPIEDLGLNEDQRFEAWWIARFLEIYGTKAQGNPATAHLSGPRPSAVGRPGAILWTIEMRMLVPKEAFSASSFPKDFDFEKTANGKPTSKSDQMALVGNAVPPLLAAACISSNLKPKLSITNPLIKAA